MVDRSSGTAVVVVDALKQFSPFACYSGKVPVTSISIGQLGATSRLCTEPAGKMEQEAHFPAALQSAVNFLIDGNKPAMRSVADRIAVVANRVP
jgi:hypothetical protein